jgi:putative membrane protein
MTWLIIIHVFGVIFWIGSLLMISSLMGQVAIAPEAGRAALIGAARRLFQVSANIGALVAVLFGIGVILAEPQVLRHGWLHLKLLLVAVMLGCHFSLRRRIEIVREGGAVARRPFSIIHGIVSAALLIILALVFLKPF